MMERKCSKRLRDLQTFLGHIITSTQTNGMKEDACLEMVGAATNMTGTVGSLSAYFSSLAKWAATEKLFVWL